MGSSVSTHFLTFLIFFLNIYTSHANPELRVLMELKSSLDPNDNILFSWQNEENPCSGKFEGVACNEHGNVANISLQGKGLSGHLTPAVSQLTSLSGLYLHYNEIKGEIPKEIANLTELVDLYLNVNGLSGSIPSEFGNMNSLQVLQLCYNQLTGSIPTRLGLLNNLNVLALQSNHLHGAIPASLGDLTQLTRLDLSYNNLFGSIPTKLAQLPQLQVLDLRNNFLSGNVPYELTRLNEGFQFSNNAGLCGSGFSTLRLCTSADLINSNRPEPIEHDPNDLIPTSLTPLQIPRSANLSARCNTTNCSNNSKSCTLTVIIGIIAVLVAGFLSGILTFAWYRRKKQKIGSSQEISDNRLSIDHAKEVPLKSASPLISLEYSNGWDPLADGRSGIGFSLEVSQSFRYNLEEVESATQYFSDFNLLGRSNFASTYKGMLRDGSDVVIKSISKSSCKSEEVEFLKGLKLLPIIRHENVVKLKGFCCSRGRGECYLVYGFVANGSLLHYLDLKASDTSRMLKWPVRVSIIKGIAKGIEYLHGNRTHKPPLIHQNLSSGKILIDENFAPKISGAGLHKLLADDVVFSTLKASAANGYLAPEYTSTGRFTEKSDIYAFGVVLFQILTGKTCVAHLRTSAESGQLDDLIDENLNGKYSRQEASKIASVALICTSEVPTQRPKMETVAKELGSF